MIFEELFNVPLIFYKIGKFVHIHIKIILYSLKYHMILIVKF